MKFLVRRGAAACTAVALLLGFAACSNDTGGGPVDTPSDGYYPHTATTRFGEVTLDTEPTNIVAGSPAIADSMLALGVEPAAVATDPATLADTTPWLADQLAEVADAELTVENQLAPEAIAAHEPDLIIADVQHLQDEESFQRLNDVAPTLVPDAEGYNIDWRERLRYVADAVNESEAAEALITDIEGEYAAVGEQVPGIEDMTYQFVRFDGEQFHFGNGSVFEMFGLQPADNQDNTQSGETIALENTMELSADFLGVWPVSPDARTTLEDNELFGELPAVQNDTVYFFETPDAFALNATGPLALRWELERVTPVITALGG